LLNSYFLVSELYDSKQKLKRIREPPITPQKIEKADPVVVYTEAKLHKRLLEKLKNVGIQILYLGKSH